MASHPFETLSYRKCLSIEKTLSKKNPIKKHKKGARRVLISKSKARGERVKSFFKESSFTSLVTFAFALYRSVFLYFVTGTAGRKSAKLQAKGTWRIIDFKGSKEGVTGSSTNTLVSVESPQHFRIS